MATEKTAADLKTELATADEATATDILNAENAREGGPRVTVVDAASARLEELATPGETLATVPEDRAWAQLLDGDGQPVLVDGQPVETELVS